MFIYDTRKSMLCQCYRGAVVLSSQDPVFVEGVEAISNTFNWLTTAIRRLE